MRIENAYFYPHDPLEPGDTIPKGHLLFLLSTGRTKLISVPHQKTLHPPRKDYQLIYMHNGSLHYYEKNGTEHIAPPGSFVLYKPYEYQEFLITAEEQADKYWCHFDGPLVEQLIEKYNLKDKRVITLPRKKRYLQLYKQMYTVLNEKPMYFAELCSLYLQELIITIGSEIKKQNQQSPYPETLAIVLNYIQNNYSEKITVDVLSKVGTTNPKTLTKLFTTYLDTSPMKYLTHYRINKAKMLLLQTDHKITEIALSVGYPDPLYFSTVFRAETGFSPREYRNKYE